jgi:hypothetical protein
MEVTMADVALGILPDVWTHLNSPEAVKRRRGKAALEARLGYAEAAALLGLKVTTLRTLVHRGQIPRPMTSTLETVEHPNPLPMTFTLKTVKRPKPRPMTFTIETAKRPRPRSTPKQAKRRTQ